MIPLLSRKLHGLTDYSYVVLVALAPFVLDFSAVRPAAMLCMVLPILILASSLLTRAEWGVLRVLPFKIHLLLDVIVGLFALAAPWIFNFSDATRARNTFLVIGIFGICAGLFSRPQEMTSDMQTSFA